MTISFPVRRILDDSHTNQFLCFRGENSAKGDCTPYEWLAASQPQRYEEVCQCAGMLMHAGLMPYAKYRRFLQRELNLDTFIERQLNDTRYIARATAEFLRCLFNADHHVLGVKGQLTAELRHHWGIENLSSAAGQSGLAGAKEAAAGRKEPGRPPPPCDRRGGYRPDQPQTLAGANPQIQREGGTTVTGRIASDPWEAFRDDLKRAVRR